MTTSSNPFVSRDIQALLGHDFAVELRRPALVDEKLFPDERSYIKQAVPQRRAEFGTARLAARDALATLGIEPCSLVPHADRSPRWPDSVKGSISHAGGCCIVVITSRTDVVGVGVDVEHTGPLPDDLVLTVCTENEQRWLQEHKKEQRPILGKLIFSAKEAFYKCQYPQTKQHLDFRDVELSIDLEKSEFSARSLALEIDSLMGRFSGRFITFDEWTLTTAVLQTHALVDDLS